MNKKSFLRKGFAVALLASFLSTGPVNALASDFGSLSGGGTLSEPGQIETELVQKEEAMKMFSDFQLYLEQGNQERKVMEFNVENDHEMYLALGEIYKEAPSQVVIKSTNLSPLKLKESYRNSRDSYKDPNKTPYIHGILNYKDKISNKTFILEDVSTPYEQESRELQNLLKGFEITTDFLAEELKSEDFEESVLNLSNFIYENFKYNSRGLNFMTISNMPNQEMACQGISLLSKTVLEKMGYNAEIRLGDSHYWVTVEKNGNPITFDPTTDIVLKEKHKTLGLSTKEHIEATSAVGFYSAEFQHNKYNDVPSYKFKTTEATKFISKDKSPFEELGLKKIEKKKEFSYKDVENHYAEDAIESLAKLGYLKHFKGEEFNPNKSITRGEFSQILAYSLHMNDSNVSANTSFKDLVNHESLKSVEYLKSRGIINGKTFNTFEPEGELTRQQAASILSRTMDEIGMRVENKEYISYKDNKEISEYAKKDVEKTSNALIFKGDENGNFNPKGALTRGQAASIVWNFIKN